MVHNGIEYGDMQLICEAYHLMKEGLGLTHDEIGENLHFGTKVNWIRFMINITKDIVTFKDEMVYPKLRILLVKYLYIK